MLLAYFKGNSSNLHFKNCDISSMVTDIPTKIEKSKKTQQGSFCKGGKMSTIYFSRDCNRKEFTAKIMEIFSEHFKKAKKFFLKPNIVSYEPYPTTTHPEILDSILNQLSNREVTVGDAPAIDAGRSNKIITKSPLKQVCDSHGVKLVNLYSEKMQKVKSPRGYKLTISTLPLTSDFTISLPVLKTHFIVGLSGALKNQFGYLSKKDRLLMHAKIKNINKGIAEVNAAAPTNLFIMSPSHLLKLFIIYLTRALRYSRAPSGLQRQNRRRRD